MTPATPSPFVAVVALVALSSAAAAETLRGADVVLARAPATQAVDLPVVRIVGDDGFHVGGRLVPAARTRDDLRVAKSPDSRPSLTLKAGRSNRPVPITWKEGATRRRVDVAFSFDGSRWSCHPAKALEFDTPEGPLRLLDVDLDGRLEAGVDAWTAGTSSVWMPLTEAVVVGAIRVTIEDVDPARRELRATLAPFEGTPTQLECIRRLNRLRADNGLPPVALDEELSAGCTEHAEYLRMNDWTGFTNPHEQTLGAAGASEAGARAARRSVVCEGAPALTTELFWITWYHRIPLALPALARVGVNATPPDVSVIDVMQPRDERAEATAFADPIAVPADGAGGVPCGSNAELPDEPVPDLGSRGFPIMLVFGGPPPALDGFEGKLWRVDERGGERAVKTLVAAPGRHPEALGIVPARPLARNQRYRADFTWTRGGETRSKSVSFTTVD